MTSSALKRSLPIAVCIVLLIVTSGQAKTFYLDNAPGMVNGSTTYDPVNRSNIGGNALVYTNPYAASTALRDGDILYVRAGEYWSDVPGSTWLDGSLGIGVSNCLIKNYNGETAWIKGGESRVTPQYHPNNAVGFGGSNNTIEGLYIYGGFIFGGTNNKLKNCDLSGGWDHQGPFNSVDAGWPNCIRFVDSKNALVQNCRIHNNVMQVGNEANMAIIMHERDDNTIIENCQFDNTAAYFGYLKYQNGTRGYPFTGSGTHVTYRYNTFYGPNGGFDLATIYPDSPNPEQRQVFYQNIFINSGAGFHSYAAATQYAWIFNNTFYNPKIAALFNWQTFSVYNFFNNIVYWDKSGTNYNQKWESDPPSPFANYIDYNDYYSPNGSMGAWLHGGFNSTSLAAWVSHTGSRLDPHSLTANPNFLNASGRFGFPSDFKRSSYPANGRGGSYNSVMGAYITGSEIIGTTSGALPPPSAKVPNPPTGLTIN